MARKKLKNGHNDSDKVKENKKFQRDCAQKGKEKNTSVSTQEGDEDMDVESQDTQSTRGRTKLNKLAVQRSQGITLNIGFNSRGQPIGKPVAEMQSFIGVLVREKVKISYNSWKQVPKSDKDLIWDTISLTFNVDPKWKKSCLSSACTKWRQYKTTLTKNFITKNKDKPEELKRPPKGHDIS